MSKKLNVWIAGLLILSFVLTACTAVQQQTGAPAGTTGGRQLEIYHWWTAPGEREAADAMFAALKAKYPDIEVVENPSPGGGGVNQRVVLQSRIGAGDYPDTFQTLGGAELKKQSDYSVLATGKRPETDTYTPGEGLAMGADHPIAWTRTPGKGRAFYTAIGHLPNTSFTSLRNA